MDREHLLKEIFELEPDLRSKENEVRTLVFAMLERKPRVFPDAAAKLLIRARLIAEYESGLPKSLPSPWTDWLWYMAPAGVAATLLLLVTFNNSQVGSTLSYSSVPSVVSSGPEARTVIVPQTASKEAGSEVSSMKFIASPDMDTESAVVTTATLQSGELIEVGSSTINVVDLAGVVLSEPSFVVIAEESTGTVVAVSQLLLSGSHEGVSLALPTDMVSGAYVAKLYRDSDGDSVFMPDFDSVVLTESGQTYSTYIGRSE